MAEDDLTTRLRATFVQELEEQVQELNRGLLALEQQPRDAEQIRSLFRAAHTVKGAARVAGVPLVEQACHALESVFAEARDGRHQLDGSDFSLFFAVVDALGEAAAALRAGRPLEGTTLHALLPRLATGDSHGAAAGSPPEASPRPGATAGGGSRQRVDAAPQPQDVASQPEDGARQREDVAAQRAEPVPEPEDPADASSHVERRTAGTGTRHDDEAAAPSGRAGTHPPLESGHGDELVRVHADRLESLLSAVGELMIVTGRIVDRTGRQDDDVRRLDQATDAVADMVHRLRLRPFADVCEALPRAVRDVAAAEGKEVELELEGQEVEADRLVVDALRMPLLQLVRNAVDHGIEPPAERERQGKRRTGRVRVRAELTGGRLVVSVSDDGRGLDADAIRRALRARGRAVPEGDAELADAVLAGGFTTRAEATRISGRGVGVDIVRSAVEGIGGALDVRWKAGAGTTFLIECPPTPATIRALLVRVGAYSFAIPTAHVERLQRIRGDQIRHVDGRAMLQLDAGPVPVHSLAALLGPPLEAHPVEGLATAVIVSAGSRRAALVIDEALDEDEVVVRPLDVDEGAVPHALGGAILPTGDVALVLAAPALLAAGTRSGRAIAPDFASPPGAPRRRILVADDSITTRMMEQSVLESAGYEVITAVNGEDAWQKLDREGADMMVADVEMPRMDGFALCRRIRASQRFAALPIALVTGLASDADRARGLDAGADAYIVKSSFDQATLLDTVRQLIGDT
jgi:two-component system, chemotaxis family, sensor kinase CheA